MVPPKPVQEEDDEEGVDKPEDELPAEDQFKCRECGKTVDVDQGDDEIKVCDKCLDKYDYKKIKSDLDKGKIPEDKFESFDLKAYVKVPKAAGAKKTTAKKSTKA